MTAAVIAKTAGDGREQRKVSLPFDITHLGSLSGTERIQVVKVKADGSLDPAPYYATAEELAAGGDTDTPITSNLLNASVATGSAVSLSTGTAKDITSVALTEGTWLVKGMVYFKAAGTTTVTRAVACVSATLDTVDTTPGRFANTYLAGATGTNIGQDIAVSGMFGEFVVGSGGATVHLVGQATFGVSTLTAYGQIDAIQLA
jgi:hypothetical protein